MTGPRRPRVEEPGDGPPGDGTGVRHGVVVPRGRTGPGVAARAPGPETRVPGPPGAADAEGTVVRVTPAGPPGWQLDEQARERTRLLDRHEDLELARTLIARLCGEDPTRPTGPDGGLDAPAVPIGVADPAAPQGDPHHPPGELLLVEGPFGHGKTTLLDEIRRMTVGLHVAVLQGTGQERENGRAFALVRQLFLNLLTGCTAAERERLLGDWRDTVAPAIGLGPAAEGAAPDPHAVRDALDWLVSGLTQHRGRIVMLVDDAQWADLESLGWLVSFARRVRRYPVLLVIARRTSEETAAGPLLDELSRMSHARRAVMRPLGRPSISRVVRAYFPFADEEFHDAVAAATAGSPLVLHRLLAEVRRRGVPPRAGHTRELAAMAAATIGDGVAAQLRELGDDVIATAHAVAVLGSDALPGRVAELAGIEPDRADRAMDRLRANGLLADRDFVAFTHPMLARAVYDWIPRNRRGRMHARAARQLVQDGLDVRAAAVHLLHTQPSSDPWAVEQLRRAARQVTQAGAPDTAHDYLERALREPPPPGERAGVLFELGNATFHRSPQDAIPYYRRALEADEADRVLRENIVLQLTRSLGFSDRIAEAVQLLDTEAKSAPSSRARLRLQAEHFMWAVFWVDDNNAQQRHRRLRRLAARLEGEDRIERCILGLRAWYGVLHGDPAVQVLSYAKRALGDGMSWVDEDWGFEVPLLLALAFTFCDRPDKAEELIKEGIGQLHEAGWRGAHLAYAHTFLGLVMFHRGALDDAESEARHALELAERVGGAVPVRWYALGLLVRILVARGNIRDAYEVALRGGFGNGFPAVQVIPEPQAVRGELRLALGLLTDAAKDLMEAGASLDERAQYNPGYCPWRQDLALAMAGVDRHGAHELARDAVERAYRTGVPSVLGQALRVQAMLEDGGTALATLEEALMWLEHSPARHEYALALVEYGSRLRAQRNNGEARRALRAGYALASQCFADGLARRARAELVAAGDRPAPLGSPGARVAHLLTAREEEAARLAATGLPNSEIALRMRVAPDTVRRYLTGVYEKLETDRDGLDEALTLCQAPDVPPVRTGASAGADAVAGSPDPLAGPDADPVTGSVAGSVTGSVTGPVPGPGGGAGTGPVAAFGADAERGEDGGDGPGGPAGPG